MDNAKVLENYKTKIKVSVQNLVEEMRDIVECGEKGEEVGKEVANTVVAVASESK